MKIDPEWWKTLFDETYLITDARSVCDDHVTRSEADMIEDLLPLDKAAPILDLCGGQGRHAIELFRRGYSHITVLDYSEYLVDLGRRTAEAAEAAVGFVRADARRTGLADCRYQAVLLMANSFGYFADAEDDRRVLEETHRLLRSGGRVLLDLVDREYMLDNFRSHSWHEIDGEIVVCRSREIQGDRVMSREVVLSKTRGLLRDAGYCIRTYGRDDIRRLLESAGFRDVSVQTDYAARKDGADYGFLTNRMLVTAAKP